MGLFVSPSLPDTLSDPYADACRTGASSGVVSDPGNKSMQAGSV